jgi:Putative Actinobacterial Holin-X, holin superfamily III
MNNEESSIVYLFKKLRDDTTTLVRDEISLAKTEISEKIHSTSRNVGYLAAGALVAYAAGILILQGISFLLRDLFISGGMNQTSASLLGFLIVGGVVGIIGALLIVKALNTLKKEPLTPTKTAETLREDKEWVQNKVS